MIDNIRVMFHRATRVLQVLMLIVMCAFVFGVSGANQSKAVDLTNRSVTLTSGVPSATTRHTFSFNYVTANTVGSVMFEYCSNTAIIDEPCIAPVGLDLTAASIALQSGITGYTISGASTSSVLIINRIPSLIVPVSSSYAIEGVVNPNAASAYYVRISVFDANDALGTRGDTGSVVFATNPLLSITAYVPPFLTFCAGRQVALNCSSITGDPLINLGEFSISGPSTATSEFSGATNIPSGYAVSILGSTMTAGTNTIAPISSVGPSQPGTAQFGINLRANAIVAGSSDPVGVGITVPEPSYNIPNNFFFQPNDIIAQSTNVTNFNRFTVSYVVNIPDGQRPGNYAATLSYVAVANL